MKRIILFILFLLVVLNLSFANGEPEARDRMRPKNFQIDKSETICYNDATREPYKDFFGYSLTLRWEESPASTEFSNGLDAFSVEAFQYYQIFVEDKKLNLTYTYKGSSDIHETTKTIIIPHSGEFTITIKSRYRIRLIKSIFYLNNPWDSSSRRVVNPDYESDTKIVIDIIPPEPPEKQIKPVYGIYDSTKAAWFTNENSSGNDGSSTTGFISLQSILPLPRDRGAKTTTTSNDPTASDLAGIRIYEGVDTLNKVYDSPITLEIIEAPLSEGEYSLSYAAFDNVALCEANNNMDAIPESITINAGTDDEPNLLNLPMVSNISPVSTIIVDRSGPEGPIDQAKTPLIENVYTDGNNRSFIIFGKNTRNSLLRWNNEDYAKDFPLDTNGTSIGVGTDYNAYRVVITDEGAQEINFEANQNEASFLSNLGLASGIYHVAIKGFDLLGNIGSAGPAATFYVDADKPNALDTNQITITGGREAVKSNGTINGTKFVSFRFIIQPTACELSFPVVVDQGEYSSGIKRYKVTDDQGRTTFTNSNSISLNLREGENIFYFQAEDNVGNLSDPVIVYIKPPLANVRFSEEFISKDEDHYILNWLDPTNAIQIQYFKTLILPFSAAINTVKSKELFNDTAINETHSFNLSSQPQDVLLVAYILAVDNDKSYSITTKEFKLDLLQEAGPRTLDGEDPWSGEINLHESIIVPAGEVLTIEDGTTVNVDANVGIYIQIEPGGKIICNGTSTGIVFKSSKAGTITHDWQGIIINGGEGEFIGTKLYNAYRGLSVEIGSIVTFENGGFYSCRIGIHSSGVITVDHARFDSCEWYGVKEDNIIENNRPNLKDCVFYNNGYSYYQDSVGNITISQLNELNEIAAEHSGNSEE